MVTTRTSAQLSAPLGLIMHLPFASEDRVIRAVLVDPEPSQTAELEWHRR